MRNFQETAMKTVQVSKTRLRVTLKENLKNHREEFEEAMAGFRDAQLQAITNIAAAAREAQDNNTSENRKKLHEAYAAFDRLEKPRDHSESYEQAIALMDWEQRDEIELSINDFECYVRDNWQWRETFKNVVSNYTSPKF